MILLSQKQKRIRFRHPDPRAPLSLEASGISIDEVVKEIVLFGKMSGCGGNVQERRKCT